MNEWYLIFLIRRNDMIRKVFGWMAALALLLGILCPGALADSLHTEIGNDALEVSVALGYDGKMTYGKSMPVRVTVRNNGEDLEGTVAVNAYASGLKYDRYETDISVPAGGERTVLLAVNAGTRQDIFTVEILRENRVICAVNTKPEGIINPSAMMIGVLSSRPRNLTYLDINTENDTLNRYEFWQTVPLTPETLPEDPQLLESFGMLVLDDPDTALWTDRQREAVRQWLEGGGLLICGGGAAAPENLAFLDCGLRVSEFTVSDGVHEALESYAGRKHTDRKPEVALAVIEGRVPLARDADGNGLLWRVPAESGAAYVLAWEAGDPAMSADPMMHAFFQQVFVRDEQSLYNNALYAMGRNGIQNTVGDNTPVPVRNSLPLAVWIVAGAAALGCAAWFLLKRREMSRWMWVVLPALAAAAGTAVLLVAASSAMNRPVAGMVVNTLQLQDGRTDCYTTVSVAAPRPGAHSYEIEGESPEVLARDEYYWENEEDEDAPKEPVILRMSRRNGERNSVTVYPESAWETVQMAAHRRVQETGRVRAEIWMEEDGLHGEVVNGTEQKLKEGTVFTIWGYVGIPALAPGESASFVLKAEDAPDPAAPVFRDGVMLRNTGSTLYSVISQKFYGTGMVDYDRPDLRTDVISSAADEVTRARAARGGTDRESATIIYSAEPEKTEAAPVFADGERIESISVTEVRTTEVEYLSVGRTGLVSRAAGMDKAVRCALDADGMPDGVMEASQSKYGYTYYDVSENPAFRFRPEGLENTEITMIRISMDEWYVNDVRLFVLNAKKQEWEEKPVNTPLDRPADYLDAEGSLYCQLRPAAPDGYTEVSAPTISVEGRVKHAAP